MGDNKKNLKITKSTCDTLYYNTGLIGMFSALMQSMQGKKVCVIFSNNPIENLFSQCFLINEKVFNTNADNISIKNKNLCFEILNNLAKNLVYRESVVCNKSRNILSPIIQKFSNSSTDGYRFNAERFYTQVLKTIVELKGEVYIQSRLSNNNTLDKIAAFAALPLGQVFEIEYNTMVDFSKEFDHYTKKILLSAPKEKFNIDCPTYIPLKEGQFYIFNRFEKTFVSYQQKSQSHCANFSKEEIECITDTIAQIYFDSNLPKNLFKIENCLVETSLGNPINDLFYSTYVYQSIENCSFSKEKLKEIFKDFSLIGSRFSFDATKLKLIEFADMKYDEVKRMGIKVDDFKKVVFNFGTDIDTIIEYFYDLFRTSPSPKDALDKSVENFQRQNEDFYPFF